MNALKWFVRIGLLTVATVGLTMGLWLAKYTVTWADLLATMMLMTAGMVALLMYVHAVADT